MRNVKIFSFMTAVSIAFSVPASATTLDPVTGNRVQNMYVNDAEPDHLDTLDLDTVLERAMNNTYNLNLLLLKAAAQDSKQKDLDQQRADMPGVSVPSGHLPATPAEIASVPGMPVLDPAVAPWIIMTNTGVNQLTGGAGQLAGGMGQILSAQRNQMKETAHQLGTDRDNTYLQSDEAKAGVRLQLTGQYVQLLAQSKQIEFMNSYKAVLEKELLRTTLLQEQGLASADDVQNVVRAMNKHKDDLTMLTNNHRLALAQLCLDIGVAYDPAIVLKEIGDIPVEPVMRDDTIELLKNSYGMKIAANNIDEAVWQQQYSVTKTTYGETYLGVNGAISMQKNNQARLELTKKIETAYNELENAYQACLAEKRGLNELKQDLAKMESRYEAGVISKHDVHKFALKVQQSETSTYAAKMRYYVLLQKVKEMKAGAIL
ncbi:TolC family protein [Paenibacillus chartarius]|uniref:TolC family protein n=1 Tax=Paenibacillus chartarius TaxID=747481 RepID=A0ABV6DF34_9BACL